MHGVSMLVAIFILSVGGGISFSMAQNEGDEGTQRRDAVSNPSILPHPNLWEPQVQPPQLVPKPHVVNWGTGVFSLNPKTVLLIESEEYRPAAESFRDEIKTRYGWNLPIKNFKSQISNLKFQILFGGSRERQRTLPVPDQPEAYCVKVTPESVQVVGRQPVGTFYGAQTLMQLVQPIPDGLQIPAVTISDYPNLAFRGVHLLGGKNSDFHARLIHNVLSHLKFNHLIVECEYTQWETNKKIWVDFSMPKPVLKGIVDTARAHFLEPIPLVQSLGHCEWMFKNGQNLDLAEDPETPYAYCPRREATYKFILRLFDETLEIFKPKYFHVGHDEITLRGRFPNSPECKGATVAQLFLEDTRRLHEYLKKKGIERVLLWSDMLLAKGEANDGAASAVSPEEAKATREGLPKDLVQCDWHYTPAEPEGYKSLNALKAAGFERIVATTWFQPPNIYTFAQAARSNQLWGLLQSTWAGFNLNEGTLRDALHQFAAYVLAAEYAWNTDSPAPEQLPYRAESVLLERYFREPIPLDPQPGFTVDLRPVYNVTLADSDGKGWAGYGAQHDLRNAPTGLARLNGWLFQLANSLEKPSALMLRSSQVPGDPSQYPTVVRIALNRKASTLLFLHCTGYSSPEKTEVGRYIIHYAGGGEEAIPLLYGVHIRAWDDPGMAFGSRVIWEGKTTGGKSVLLRVLRWQNPHPDKPIREIEFRATDGVASPALVGLSGM